MPSHASRGVRRPARTMEPIRWNKHSTASPVLERSSVQRQATMVPTRCTLRPRCRVARPTSLFRYLSIPREASSGWLLRDGTRKGNLFLFLFGVLLGTSLVQSPGEPRQTSIHLKVQLASTMEQSPTFQLLVKDLLTSAPALPTWQPARGRFR